MGDVIPFDPEERAQCDLLEVSVLAARVDVARRAFAAAKAAYLARDPLDALDAFRIAADYAAAADHLVELQSDALRVFASAVVARARAER